MADDARPTTDDRRDVPVVPVSWRDLRARVRAELDEFGVSWDEFVAAGREGRIEDPELRALWLRVGPIVDG